jgi:hypothetical protein
MVLISEDKLGKYFGEAFKEVVLPALEDMETRLKNELASKKDIYRIEERLEKLDERLDRQGKVQDNLQKRVGKIEMVVQN